jgi:hypothetical protein
MAKSELISSIIWGALVGFVGWKSCFHLVEPISNWLLFPAIGGPISKSITRLIVLLFLVLSNLMVIALLPMLLVNVGSRLVPSTSDEFRNAFGVAFASSVGGFICVQAIVRFSK